MITQLPMTRYPPMMIQKAATQATMLIKENIMKKSQKFFLLTPDLYCILVRAAFMSAVIVSGSLGRGGCDSS